ncbi:MAG TPA: TRL-like family protein [Myxococcota bacterium]|nr:TRL-like family protein [Myxococcota bacterium]
MRKLGALMVLAACLPLAGCISVATPAIGILFTDVTYAADGQGAIGAKEGKACAQSILGLIAQGDASIEAAAKNGGIKTVSTIDHSAKNMLGIIGDYCTIVHGS